MHQNIQMQPRGLADCLSILCFVLNCLLNLNVAHAVAVAFSLWPQSDNSHSSEGGSLIRSSLKHCCHVQPRPNTRHKYRVWGFNLRRAIEGHFVSFRGVTEERRFLKKRKRSLSDLPLEAAPASSGTLLRAWIASLAPAVCIYHYWSRRGSEVENRSISVSALHTAEWHVMTFTPLAPMGSAAGSRNTQASKACSEKF